MARTVPNANDDDGPIQKSARSGLESGPVFTHTFSNELLHRLPRLHECRGLVGLECPPCDRVVGE